MSVHFHPVHKTMRSQDLAILLRPQNVSVQSPSHRPVHKIDTTYSHICIFTFLWNLIILRKMSLIMSSYREYSIYGHPKL